MCQDTSLFLLIHTSNCACKGILQGVLLGVESWGHSPFRTCFPFQCKEDLASSKSHIPWDSTQNQRRCGFSVMLGCPSQNLIQGERTRRKGKEMATGTTPRQRHTSETTLHRNPSESPLSCTLMPRSRNGPVGCPGHPPGRKDKPPASARPLTFPPCPCHLGAPRLLGLSGTERRGPRLCLPWSSQPPPRTPGAGAEALRP